MRKHKIIEERDGWRELVRLFIREVDHPLRDGVMIKNYENWMREALEDPSILPFPPPYETR